jgi:hypothetical protein
MRAYARAFGRLSCTCTCVHARVRACACVCVCACLRVHVCVRAPTCVHACVYTVVYVRVCACVRCVLVRACEGIQGALPLGVLLPQERASLPSCLSTLGALRSGLEAFPTCPFMLKIYVLIPVQALRGPRNFVA